MFHPTEKDKIEPEAEPTTGAEEEKMSEGEGSQKDEADDDEEDKSSPGAEIISSVRPHERTGLEGRFIQPVQGTICCRFTPCGGCLCIGLGVLWNSRGLSLTYFASNQVMAMV